ncbi:hypothetical protein [Phenylobacterium sp.]|jgi:hypothetical protein|uniref:hypothetical protein n=1 Tax=Phenylobacterium sp. TaxID=1871053 RepID=UPI0035B209C2
MRLTTAIRCTLLLRGAQHLAATGDYAAAAISLERIYDLIGFRMPSPEAPIELNLLAGLVALRLERRGLAIQCAAVAVTQMRDGKGRFTPAERAHLERYARQVGDRAAWEAGRPHPWCDHPETPAPLSGRVSARLRARFPLISDALPTP